MVESSFVQYFRKRAEGLTEDKYQYPRRAQQQVPPNADMCNVEIKLSRIRFRGVLRTLRSPAIQCLKQFHARDD